MTDGNTERGRRDRVHRVPWRILVGAPIMALALGLATDACSGFALRSGVRSSARWLAALLGSGAMYLLAEGAAGWIGSRDKVTNPLWSRVLHLTAILALVAVLVFGAWLISVLAR